MPTDPDRNEDRPPPLLRKNGALGDGGTRGRVFRRIAIFLRTGIALILALAAITAGLAWSANWVFPLAVLQKIGLASPSSLHGVRWSISLPHEEAAIAVSIGVQQWNIGLMGYCFHRDVRDRYSQEFYLGSWYAAIRTHKLPGSSKRRTVGGASAVYRSLSMAYLELPLWGVFPILAAFPTVMLFRGPIRRRRRRKRGLCLHCGYDVRLLPEPRCPECGTPTENTTAE